MPIQKVPIVHKFGIISHSQRLQLQERLLKQTYLNAQKKPQFTEYKNELEVSDEFITNFNNAVTYDEKEKYANLAHKMLERIKRKSGLRDGGKGSHVNLPVAWTELSQLAQCKGKLQEECLDVLILSLDQAPLSVQNIPALFYLAETCLYWLRTDAIHQPFLRTSEIKLLKMGQIVFFRLFYHFMVGNVRGHKEYKIRLFTYLDGFSNCQEAYNPYPNALLCIRYITEIGKILVADALSDEPFTPENETPRKEENEPNAKYGGDEIFREVPSNYNPQSDRSGQAFTLSSSVHDLSPTLWHALDVWRCVIQLGGGIESALRSLSHCGKQLATESWVDGMCAIHILAEAAKSDLNSLRAFQNLARGVVIKEPAVVPSVHDDETSGLTETVTLQTEDLQTVSYSNHPSLSDIYEKPEDESPYKTVKSTSEHSNAASDAEDSEGSNIAEQGGSTRSSSRSDVDDNGQYWNRESGTKTDNNGIKAENSGYKLEKSTVKPENSGIKQSDRKETDLTNLVTMATGQFSEMKESDVSSVHTFTNKADPNIAGIHGWNWEVAVTFVELLADITLHGSTSAVKKMALVGNNKDITDLHRRNTYKVPMKSAGLLDLVYFRAENESKDWGPNDWSWRVRYTAIQGLVKICRCCASDKTKEGIRNVAWSTLVKANAHEKDERVLEALKVGQVDANLEANVSKVLAVPATTLGAKIAWSLSQAYLPPLPPVMKTNVTPRSSKTTPRKSNTPPAKSPPKKTAPARTTLKNEIMLANALQEKPPDYFTRMSFDLKRVVEDQWRKDLHKQLEEEEIERQEALEKKQDETEVAERERAINKEAKFKKAVISN